MKQERKNPITEVFSYATDKTKAIYSVLLAMISVFGGLVPYFSAANLVILIIGEKLSYSDVLFWGGCAIAGYIMKSICYTLASGCSHKMAYSILAEIRSILTNKLLKVSLGDAEKKTAGEYKQILMDEIEHLEYPLAHMLPELTSHFLGFAVILVSMMIYAWQLALASIVTLIIGFFIYGMMMAGKDVRKMFQTYTKDSELMSSAMVEYVSGMEVIKAFGQTASSMEKFRTAILTFCDSMKEWFAHCFPYLAGFYVVTPNSLLLLMPIGVLLMSTGTITLNTFVFCMFLSFGISEPIIKAMEFADHIMTIVTTIEKVDEILDMEDLPEGIESLNNIETIEAKNITFGYTKNNPVIQDISFSIKCGQKIAFVGSSGSGKSTLAKLLVRFYDPDSGSIQINGTDICNISLKELMRNISFVTQDNFLFDTSIMDNIRVGNPLASDSDVISASKKAACEEFIQTFPDGYQTKVGDSGGKLSGGQRQRIAITRTILKDAPIVILDEASAFIDPENEDKIQKSIESLTEGKTLIMIAHRLHTIMNCDCIYVVDEGNIIANGTHSELLKNCSVYQNLWNRSYGEVI